MSKEQVVELWSAEACAVTLRKPPQRKSKQGNRREAYYRLTKIDLPKPFDGNLSLCHLCKYALWRGDCYFAELDCQHQLEIISEKSYDVWEGNDCWGFRPKYRYKDAVDITGIYLRGQTPDWEKLDK